jgi:zinc-finger of transposase IS204/IS1001/IS1096/IS1165
MTQRTPGPGIQVLEAEKPNGSWIVSAVVGLGSGRCPDCASLSTSRHSRYVRHLQDLPVQGITVTLRVKLSWWRCRDRGCERKTFSDLLPRIAQPVARRTRRVSELAQLVGHAAGGRPAERLMTRLGLPHPSTPSCHQLFRKIRPPDPTPSLRLHYSAFITTTGRSAPTSCVGTLASRWCAAYASPLASGSWFLQFRAEACIRLTPPLRRPPSVP